MQVRSGSFLATLLLGVATASPAQENDPATQDFFADAPLILTASRLTKPLLESPASVSVIDRRAIDASGARELADLFRLVPGFVVGYHSGHAPAVSYHGLGQEFGRQIQVLIDGRSVFIPSFGGVPWSNLPLLLEDIERIEVIRGPNAATYGANAFLATINIITRDAAEDRGARYSLTASDNANPDIEDAYLRLGGHGLETDWRLSLGAINDEGFAAINDSKRVAKINFRLDYAPRHNQFWTLHGGSSDSTAGRGFAQSADNPTDIERDEEASNRYLNLSWEGVWASSVTLARLTHTRQDVSDNYDPGPFSFGGSGGVTTFIDFDRSSVRSEFELLQRDEIDPRLRLVYGAGLRRDRVRSLFLLGDDEFHEVDTGRLFGGVEWRASADWLFDLGVMLEDSSLSSLEASPRISLVRKLNPRQSLRLVAAAARRNPILWEAEGKTEFVANVPAIGTVVVPTWQGNPDIEPETIESYELGLRSDLGNGFGNDIKLFYYEIRDHIDNVEIPGSTVPPTVPVEIGTTRNDHRTEVSGIEAEFDFAPIPRVDLRAGFSLIDAESSLDLLEDSFPDYTAFVSVTARLANGHELGAALYYLDEISWIDSGADIPAARRLDLRYAIEFGADTRLEVIGQNLLEDYSDYESENVHDRLVYLRLSSGF